MSKDTEVLYR